MAKNIFNSILLPKVATNRFDLSHDVKMSFSMGELVPTTCMEVLPGDRFNIGVQNMLRFAPLISPVMHRIRVDTHYFFVPYRLLWPEWDKWITGDLEVEAPYVALQPGDNFPIGCVADYIGLPTEPIGVGSVVRINPMHLAAYRLIWDEYYRDQNLQTEVFKPLVPGDNSANYGVASMDAQEPLRRAWQHDYFTAALPFAQKGDAVQVPLTEQNDIPVELDLNATLGPGQFKTTAGATPSGDLTQNANIIVASPDTQALRYDPQGSLKVDVQAGATDINTLRRAFRIQEWLERNARGGTRYVENILAHFGVKSSDARLQRPEYVGGAHQNMIISEVLATAQETTANVPVGNMAGHGISVGGGNRFNYRSEEHGVMIGIINVRPDTAYQQGFQRKFTRFDPLDYAWPTFANIGEQEVYQQEVYGASTTPRAIFGYVPRYAEYKFENNRVAGDFRETLAFWHLGRVFATEPQLNEEFIKCFPDNRIFAVSEPDADHIFSHIFNSISVVRKLPRYGVPSI